jgi:alkylhydroperoxidase family enzyme
VTSGARIQKLAPALLDEEQRSLYDAIAGGRRAQGPQLFRLTDEDGRLEGPFNAFLLQPRLGSALQALGSSVRYDTGLDDRCREIAILVVAAHWRSDFEWYAHEAVARSAGLDDAELAAVRDGRSGTVRAAHPGGLLRDAGPPAPRVPRPGARRPLTPPSPGQDDMRKLLS